MNPRAHAGSALRLSAFYAAYFLVAGVMLPFWPLYLGARGLESAEIGLVLGLALWLRAGIGPFIGRYADRAGTTRAPLVLAAVLALMLMVPFFWTAGFWPLLLATAAFSLAYASVLPFGETLALRSVSAEAGYGRVRLWGSVAFVAAAALGGAALEAERAPSATLIVWLVLGTVAILVAASAALPERPSPRTPTAVSFRALLSDRPFRLFILATAAIHGAHTVYYGFASLHWQAIGIPTWIVGLLWSTGVIAEIILFAFGAPLARRLGPAHLFLIAALAGVVRWAVLASTAEIWLLFLAQTLHGFTFGAMHLGAMLFIARRVPGGLANTAQALFAALTNGAGLGLGLLLAGWLYALWQADAYWAAVVMSGIGGLAALALARSLGRGDRAGSRAA